MKIRLTKTLGNPDVKMKAGMIFDFEDHVARYYVAAGKAEFVEETKVVAEKIAPPVNEKAVKEERETAVRPKLTEAHDDMADEPEKINVAAKVNKPKPEPAKPIKKKRR